MVLMFRFTSVHNPQSKPVLNANEVFSHCGYINWNDVDLKRTAFVINRLQIPNSSVNLSLIVRFVELMIDGRCGLCMRMEEKIVICKLQVTFEFESVICCYPPTARLY